MKKTIIILVLTILLLNFSFNVFSEVSHTAEEVKPGTFGGNFASGNFSFPDSISVTNSVSSSKVCIGGDCRGVWPSDSSNSGWQDTGSSVVLISNTDKVGIGTSSPSSKLDVNGSAKIGSSSFGWSHYKLSSSPDQYFKIAVLPPSTSSTYDSLLLEGVLDDNLLSYQKSYFKVLMSNRGGFKFFYDLSGDRKLYSHIKAYKESDGSISVYAVFDEGHYTSMSLNVLNSINVNLFPDPVVNSSPVTGDLVFDTAINQSRITINNNGNVGIGTISPSYKLDVNGSFRVNNGHLRIKTSVVNPLRINTSYPYNYIELGGGAQNLGLTVNTGDSSSFFVWHNASGQWRFFTRGGSASNIKMVIEDTGNVGIGTISPSVPLEVYTSSSPGFMLRGDPDIVLNSTPGVSSIAQIKFYNSSVRYGELGYNFASKKLYLTSNASRSISDFVIDISGNVGIGTSSPSYKLDVSSSGTAIRGVSSSGYGIYGYSSSGTGVYGSGSSYGVRGYAYDSWGVYCNAGSGSNSKCGGNKAWTTSSDIRVKDDVKVLVPSSEKNVVSNVVSDPSEKSFFPTGFLTKKVFKNNTESNIVPVNIVSKILKVNPIIYHKDVSKLSKLRILNKLFFASKSSASLKKFLVKKGLYEKLVSSSREEWDPSWFDVLLNDDSFSFLNSSGFVDSNELSELMSYKEFKSSGSLEVGFSAQELKDYFPEVVSFDNVSGTYGIAYSELIPYLFLAVRELNDKIEGNVSVPVVSNNVSDNITFSKDNGTVMSFSNGCNVISNSSGIFWIC